MNKNRNDLPRIAKAQRGYLGQDPLGVHSLDSIVHGFDAS